MTTLSLGTCQAQNSEAVCRSLAGWLSDRLGMTIRYEDGMNWQARYAALDSGMLDICWICGLPYVWRSSRPTPNIELLAAPVALGARYGGRPVYFSDVIVRADSPYRTFADLQGARWGFNEPGSWSGYGVLCYHLATLGHTLDTFGRVVETGAHQESIRRVLAGEIDTAAVDSTVLELEIERDPSLAAALRVVETLGPSPQPPWVIGTHVPPELRRAIRGALLGMHADAHGRQILAAGRVVCFVPITDAYYDAIRQMASVAGLSG